MCTVVGTSENEEVVRLREIKFRAWIENSMGKYMDYEPTLCGDGILSSIFINDAMVRTDKKFMQYTGLKDKNGKEIYEGDIVNNTRGYQDKLMLVKWSEAIEEISSSGCEWTRQNPGFVFENISKGMTYVFIANKDLEVIGNIYENPELLGDSN